MNLLPEDPTHPPVPSFPCVKHGLDSMYLSAMSRCGQQVWSCAACEVDFLQELAERQQARGSKEA